MKHLLTALALLILVTVPVKAKEGTVWIQGVRDCGTWLEHRRAEGFESLANETWLIGFLSGLGVGTRLDFWRMNNRITTAQVFYWMDKYCRENPLSDLSEGSARLFKERQVN